MENLICRIDSKYKYLKFSVYLVHKCNFNDERLIADEYIELDSLSGRELTWLDPYLNKNKTNKKKVALASVDSARLTLLIKNAGEISEEKSELIIYVTDDYDDTYIISSHVSLSNYKI